MSNTPRKIHVFVLFFVLLPLTGCLLRNRRVVTHISTANLKDATLQQLVDSINTNAAGFKSFKAEVDIDASLGGKKKGKVTDYKDYTDYPELAGHILLRKPEMLRLRGSWGIAGTMFEMVNSGSGFSLSIPPKKKFWIGSNNVPDSIEMPDSAKTQSKQTRQQPLVAVLERLRPQSILDALLLKEIGPNEEAVMEHGVEIVKDEKTHKDAEQADYVVIVIRKEDGNPPHLARKIIFSRTDLLPHRQLIYDKQGRLVTDVRYDRFFQIGAIQFPGVIDIERPIEEFDIQVSFSKESLHLDVPIADEQFVLTQPPGTQLINLDDKTGISAPSNIQPASHP
ncbi:MAG TPA: hypothetical protein VKZ53_31520 [Candidatus Angelobacter sp.]|nr:hypothetical protein [Candidatus Angelobacter sp.]